MCCFIWFQFSGSFFLRSFCRPGYCLKHLNPLMFMCVTNTAEGTFNMQKVFFFSFNPMTHQHNDTHALIAGFMDLFNPVSYLIVIISFAVSQFFFFTVNGTQVNPGWVLPLHDIFWNYRLCFVFISIREKRYTLLCNSSWLSEGNLIQN